MKVFGVQRRIMGPSDPQRLASTVTKFHGDARKLTHQMLSEISPHVTLALAGIVYAYFLGPDDLLISEDALLLRKHQFVDPAMAKSKEALFPQVDLRIINESSGSYLLGGFAGFSAIAGRLAAAGREGHGDAVVDTQMAALRDAALQSLSNRDLRLVGLKVQTARDWITRSAKDAAVAADLSEATIGLLSLSRRRALLNGLYTDNWPAVWEAVTLGDLYRLGSKYVKDRDAWRGAPRLAPYEAYERYMSPSRTAQRAAEFQLYLAESMDRAGVPAAVFGAIAEPLARTVFSKLRMTDARDWRSVLAAFQEINPQMIQEALTKP